MKIRQVIVVEGKKDTQNLKRWLDVDTIETGGTGLDEKTLRRIREMAKTRGVIIFTDPDTPGDQIRQRVNQAVPGCLNAFLTSGQAWEVVQGKRKVGVEHAGREAILQALEHLMSYDDQAEESLSWQDYVELGFTGRPDSAQRRKKAAERWHLGEANAKTLWKRMKMMKITREILQREGGMDNDGQTDCHCGENQ